MSEHLCASLWAGLGEGAFAHAGFQGRRSSPAAERPASEFAALHAGVERDGRGNRLDAERTGQADRAGAQGLIGLVAP